MTVQTLIKQPGESRLFVMDFSGLMSAGETIASVTNVTASPTGLTLSGSPVASGQTASQRILGGTDGQQYKVTFTVLTSLSNILEGEGLLLVKDL